MGPDGTELSVNRREGPILQGRGTIHDGPQEDPVRRGSKEKAANDTE